MFIPFACVENRAKSRPAQGERETDKRQKRSKSRQRKELTGIKGENVGRHRHHAVDVGQHRTENCVQKMSLRGKIKT